MATDPSAIPVPDPTETLARVVESTAHLIATAEQFDDAAVREPSLLPGWTRGHVLTHVARNADAVMRLLTWAETGVETPMYASAEEREAEIEQGAGRSAQELVADVRESSERFAEQAARLTEEQWKAEIAGRRGGPQPAAWLPWWRLEEMLIHHVDLGVSLLPRALAAVLHRAGTGPDRRALLRPGLHPGVTRVPRARRGRRRRRRGGSGLRDLAEKDDEQTPIVRGPSAALVAWLIGRSNGDGLNVEPHGALPQPPTWK
jgi:maleylpyruvate isomerase